VTSADVSDTADDGGDSQAEREGDLNDCRGVVGPVGAVVAEARAAADEGEEERADELGHRSAPHVRGAEVFNRGLNHCAAVSVK